MIKAVKQDMTDKQIFGAKEIEFAVFWILFDKICIIEKGQLVEC